MKNCRRVLAFLLPLLVLTAHADLQLPALFSDNMVMQQGMAVPVWGWAEDGSKVTVSFRGETVSTVCEHGHWLVRLPKLKPGGADTLTVNSAGSTIQFTNVMVGEVWLCSGQSNMELPMRRSFQSEADIAAATNTLIHLFHVKDTRSLTVMTNVVGTWEVCSPDTLTNFSAVGYYFGREIQAVRGVPLGLIESDWGGTPAEAWTGREALAAVPRLQTEILEADVVGEKAYEIKQADFDAQKAAAEQAGNTFTNKPPRRPWRPAELYNGMIAPLVPYSMKGVIWYQGEANAERAEQYRTLFPNMIRNWRTDWAEGDFPFLCVQLAPFDKVRKRPLEVITNSPMESDWAELRDAQWNATKILPKVGMAVITDIGTKDDIHPRHKEPVGHRLALAARAMAYGEKIEYSGPLYRSMKVRHGKIILSFDHVGQGLEAHDGALTGFAICGADAKWVWASAEIQPDNTIIVSNPDVTKPVSVRYGWADFPVVNLWNKDGLPAAPFRTDNFPLITAAKK